MSGTSTRPYWTDALRLLENVFSRLSTSVPVHAFTIVFVFAAWSEGKNSTWLLYFATCVLVCLWRSRRFTRVLLPIFLALTWISLFIPVNVDLRHGDTFTVRVLPVEYDLGYRQHLRDLESEGLQENRDYIVIRKGMPTFPPLKKSLVIIVPGKEDQPR